MSAEYTLEERLTLARAIGKAIHGRMAIRFIPPDQLHEFTEENEIPEDDVNTALNCAFDALDVIRREGYTIVKNKE